MNSGACPTLNELLPLLGERAGVRENIAIPLNGSDLAIKIFLKIKIPGVSYFRVRGSERPPATPQMERRPFHKIRVCLSPKALERNYNSSAKPQDERYVLL